MEDTRLTTAIILRRQPYRESDSRVWLYSPDFGKLELVARGTQKPGSKLAGHLEPLTLSKVMIVFGHQRSYIGSAINDCAFSGLKSDLNSLYFAGQALQIFDRLVKPGLEDAELYDLLAAYLQALDEFSDQNRETVFLESFYHFFLLKLLTRLGYEPNLSQCVSGRHPLSESVNHFDFSRSGVVCPDCRRRDQVKPDYRVEEWLALSVDCLKTIKFVAHNDFTVLARLRLSKPILSELGVFSKTYLHWHLY
jgi:DNA repair protein RecO (recombination protein O)